MSKKNPFRKNTATYRDPWPFDSVASKKLEEVHKKKATRRKLDLATIFAEAKWSAYTKLIALRLYDFCHSSKNWSRQCSQDWIARKTGCSLSTVNRVLKMLERINLVKVFRRGLGLTHTYQFNIPEWLERRINKIPDNNHCFEKQVRSPKEESRLDLTSYKQYTQYKDCKETRIEEFRLKNPEKAKEFDGKFPQNNQQGHIPKPFIDKLEGVVKASKETVANCMASLNDLFPGRALKRR